MKNAEAQRALSRKKQRKIRSSAALHRCVGKEVPGMANLCRKLELTNI
jgi:hypothetical protein